MDVQNVSNIVYIQDIQNCIFKFLPWNKKIFLNKTYYKYYNNNASTIQKAWISFSNKLNILDKYYSNDDSYSHNIILTPEEDNDLYERFIIWFRYCLYNKKNEKHIIPIYVNFFIKKCFNLGLINSEQREKLNRIKEQCHNCKHKKYIALFFALSKDILTPQMIENVGL